MEGMLVGALVDALVDVWVERAMGQMILAEVREMLGKYRYLRRR